jgi:hypothetical protein
VGTVTRFATCHLESLLYLWSPWWHTGSDVPETFASLHTLSGAPEIRGTIHFFVISKPCTLQTILSTQNKQQESHVYERWRYTRILSMTATNYSETYFHSQFFPHQGQHTLEYNWKIAFNKTKRRFTNAKRWLNGLKRRPRNRFPLLIECCTTCKVKNAAFKHSTFSRPT